MNKTIADVTNCTGCGACNNVCPHKAISMQINYEI
ncbi:MAG: 4Fe-4S dicluster domain-containing protein [Alphaproteobacteria bacterium]|nr:4Fe-4S dicluster domain-containing protein [Alphaproteobacteria bacterium]